MSKFERWLSRGTEEARDGVGWVRWLHLWQGRFVNTRGTGLGQQLMRRRVIHQFALWEA